MSSHVWQKKKQNYSQKWNENCWGASSVGSQHDATRVCCWAPAPAAWRPQLSIDMCSRRRYHTCFGRWTIISTHGRTTKLERPHWNALCWELTEHHTNWPSFAAANHIVTLTRTRCTILNMLRSIYHSSGSPWSQSWRRKVSARDQWARRVTGSTCCMLVQFSSVQSMRCD